MKLTFNQKLKLYFLDKVTLIFLFVAIIIGVLWSTMVLPNLIRQFVTFTPNKEIEGIITSIEKGRKQRDRMEFHYTVLINNQNYKGTSYSSDPLDYERIGSGNFIIEYNESNPSISRIKGLSFIEQSTYSLIVVSLISFLFFLALVSSIRGTRLKIELLENGLLTYAWLDKLFKEENKTSESKSFKNGLEFKTENGEVLKLEEYLDRRISSEERIPLLYLARKTSQTLLLESESDYESKKFLLLRFPELEGFLKL